MICDSNSNIIDQINKILYENNGYTLFEKNTMLYVKTKEDIAELTTSFDYIIDKYGKLDCSNIVVELIKEDMNIKVFVLNCCVIRICQAELFKKYYEDTFDFIMAYQHPNLENIYEVITKNRYTYIISKKVIPLLSNMKPNPLHKIDFDRVFCEITALISDLKSCNKSHGDPRLDNTGYDPDIDKYILFDFDKFTTLKTNNNDREILYESIEWFMKMR